jgi:hypothetical protein
MNPEELRRRITEEEGSIKSQIDQLVIEVKKMHSLQERIFALQNCLHCLKIDPVFYFERMDGVVK